MSHRLVMALFQDVSGAAEAARAASRAGGRSAPTCRSSRAITGRGRRSRAKSTAAPAPRSEDSPAASRLGELSGYILAAIAIGLPGTGAVVAAGPLAAELGEVAGHGRGRGRRPESDARQGRPVRIGGGAMARANRERRSDSARRARAIGGRAPSNRDVGTEHRQASFRRNGAMDVRIADRQIAD